MMFVARGRTVMIDGAARGPGEQVELPPDEAQRLAALGFLQETPPDLTPRPVNTSGVGIQNRGMVQGPDFGRTV